MARDVTTREDDRERNKIINKNHSSILCPKASRLMLFLLVILLLYLVVLLQASAAFCGMLVLFLWLQIHVVILLQMWYLVFFQPLKNINNPKTQEL